MSAPLASKLKLKSGQRASLLNAPRGYRGALGRIPPGVTFRAYPDGTYDWIQVFAKNSAELGRLAPRAVRALRPDGILWVSFPKGTSPLQSDLTRDDGWEPLRRLDLKWVTLVSVNETWSAFAVRPYKEGETRQSFR